MLTRIMERRTGDSNILPQKALFAGDIKRI